MVEAAYVIMHYFMINLLISAAYFRDYDKLPHPRRVGAMALPPFHIFGIVTELYVPIAYLVTTVVYPPRSYNDPFAQPVIPTSDSMVEQLQQIECRVLMTVPTFLEQMVESDAAVEALKKMDAVVRFTSCSLPHLVLNIFRRMGVVLYLLRSARNCGPPGYNSPVVMAGRNLESPWQYLISKISQTVIGCGCVSQTS